MNVYQILSRNSNLIFSYKLWTSPVSFYTIFFCIEFDTGSSSKEQTFDVEMNPKSGHPEVRKFTRLQISWYFCLG